MIITLDTSQPLTDAEKAVLYVLLDPRAQPKPTPEPDQESGQRIQGGDTDLAGATERVDLEALRATAVAKATELLSNGQAAKVREALDGRARKVSELTDDQLQAFVDAL